MRILKIILVVFLFQPGFKKFWKKLFLSEASVAVLQDTFWWLFLHKFDEVLLKIDSVVFCKTRWLHCKT